MIMVSVILRKFEAFQLRDELISAGVSIGVIDSLQTPFSIMGNSLLIRVADGTDPQIVRQVWQAHVPPAEKTTAKIKRNLAAKLLEEETSDAVRTKAIVITFSKILNNLVNNITTSSPLRTWTPQQIMKEIKDEINKMIPD